MFHKKQSEETRSEDRQQSEIDEAKPNHHATPRQRFCLNQAGQFWIGTNFEIFLFQLDACPGAVSQSYIQYLRVNCSRGKMDWSNYKIGR